MTLITTLIPAYKPEHLGDTLDSLRRQSLRDFRVIVSDDSPGGAITELIRDGRWRAATNELDLLVVRGPGNARHNHQQLVDLWDGSSPLVHLLMDDDVVFPGFYEAHAQALSRGRFALSASPRWLSRDNAAPAWGTALPDCVTGSALHEVALTAGAVFDSVVVPCQNWIGELSNMVWTDEGLAHYPRPPVHGLSYYGLLDIGAVLTAVESLPMVVVRDHLGVFRQHGAQTTHTVGQHGHRVALLCWAATALHAWSSGRIDDAGALRAIGITVQRCLQLYPEGDPVMDDFYRLVQGAGGGGLHGLLRAFTPWWLALLHAHPATAPFARDREPASAATEEHSA